MYISEYLEKLKIKNICLNSQNGVIPVNQILNVIVKIF